MMLPYRMLVGAARLASPLLARGDSKLARGMAGRRHAHELLTTWGRTVRDPERAVVWFHAPSVGEGLQARAVIEALHERRPEVQVVFTFFSPSAEEFARSVGADVSVYLPWDLPGPSGEVLDAMMPDLLVFTKTEVWPVLTEEATRRGVPVTIVGATVPDGAGRMRGAARWLLESTWASLTLACANAESDADRLRVLGVRSSVVHVTGDPGIDSAARRFEAAPAEAPWLVPFANDVRPTIVAGSTWPADEAVLLPALRTVRAAVPNVRVVIAPHEPGEDHVAPLRAALERAGWSTATLDEVEEAGSVAAVDAVVVNRTGVLAHLYGVASASYVGGGFHDAGLHSTLEPAAASTPIVFGPRHSNARAASDLVELRGAKIAAGITELAAVLEGWLTDDAARVRAGQAARGYIDTHSGAARRTAELLDALIAPNSDPVSQE
jgi:3-deoxy-D-manno-octulosonic-acid transferase